MKADEIFKGLNKEQKEAVTYGGGPLLVVAGAGTGKTQVITRKIAYLIIEKICKPEEILALTFTKKAAREMEERVDLLVPYGYVDFKIGTFHSIAEELIREYAYFLGLSSTFKILTLPNQVQLLSKNIFSLELKTLLPLSDPTALLADILKFISRLKDENITPEEFKRYAKRETRKPNPKIQNKISNGKDLDYLKEIARVYEKYQKFLLEGNFLDYGDLILYMLKLLDDKGVGDKIRSRFRYILVDEYQDTNWAQGEIIKKLSPKGENLTVVGDDDQSIYAFRGASLSSLLEYKKSYPRAKIIVLKQNFRSTQKILDLSYRLICHNNPDRLEEKFHFNKKLIARHEKSGLIKRMGFTDILSEAEYAAGEIIKIKKQEKLLFADFAILIRANAKAKPFIGALSRHGIPFVFSGDLNLFGRREIIDILSFINYLVNPLDDLAFLSLATSEFFAIDPRKLSIFLHILKRKNYSVNKYFQNPFRTDELNDEFLQQVKQTDGLINKYRTLSLTWPAGELIFKFIDEIGYRRKLASRENQGEIAAAEKLESLALFFDWVKSFDESSPDRSIYSFADFLKIVQELGEENKAGEGINVFDAVNVLTVHKAKGLEFDTVFIVDLLDSRFPATRKGEKLPFPDELLSETVPSRDAHYQEERRLFYVAMTRAKRNLFLTHSLDAGGKKTAKISRFLMEIFGQSEIPEQYQKPKAIERLEEYRKYEISNIAKIKKPRLQSLDAHKIDDYLTCPRKYKYVNITPIKMSSEPVVMYGSSIHKALEFLFKAKMNGVTPTLPQALGVYKDAWEAEGFISPEHEKRKFDRGIESMTDFFNSQFSKIHPLAVEKKFKFKIDGIPVLGKFDLIERGKGGEIIITDFKTTEKMDEASAKKRVKDSNQLKIYALGYCAQEGKLPDFLSLFFIDAKIRERIAPDKKTMEETEIMIKQAAAGIDSGNFGATPDFMKCQYCAFRKYCDEAILR